MRSGRESRDNPINLVFDKIEDILSETWEKTGFGEVTIESEREKKNLIRVTTVKGSTHYRYFITDEDVEEWKSRR
ncbi:MAG: hypothetical protein JGK12_06605 [Microcoleus sp. PH2017_01_SCD_O_A]|nr:hypothetical protein [Microcoleus sp. PH2017_01_SCD_O_A]MCC3432575.1 hypothetical protein [Microcoleus sp. PH2017_04_SCI_O_A]MCC3440644.1 hypothetical protein [Microcoleus sp. PH2017_03_ELD_O_A]MCC3449019.1 hypothetical protein [Microcoleus sp. PH2017_09_SFU_O_A]MCC3492281.1 hypothetical protein [Microcoleus sp. PH2017_16_JOR_D_A]MCC3503882.1 hypothetical protein [Microcoleus sp. PH2017_19_SFW_U_A]MCC3516501.1 hypothetical protein [Microcoleus sp. PH2017_18_LLB_O_A]MCC3523316.1 hypothetic